MVACLRRTTGTDSDQGLAQPDLWQVRTPHSEGPDSNRCEETPKMMTKEEGMWRGKAWRKLAGAEMSAGPATLNRARALRGRGGSTLPLAKRMWRRGLVASLRQGGEGVRLKRPPGRGSSMSVASLVQRVLGPRPYSPLVELGSSTAPALSRLERIWRECRRAGLNRRIAKRG